MFVRTGLEESLEVVGDGPTDGWHGDPLVDRVCLDVSEFLCRQMLFRQGKGTKMSFLGSFPEETIGEVIKAYVLLFLHIVLSSTLVVVSPSTTGIDSIEQTTLAVWVVLGRLKEGRRSRPTSSSS
jgi:hypothetical protein